LHHRFGQSPDPETKIVTFNSKKIMNALVNSVRLLGNLGKDPVVKTFSNGGKIANLSLATAYTFKDKEGNKVEETDWHNLVIKGKQAEIAEKYLSKGSRIAVEGAIRTRKYNDSEGQERYITEIVVNEFQMLGSKSDK
jgi:single-strand DNA-binding protein